MKYFSIYYFFILAQLIINLKIQPGYIHPDEFFQSVEISAGSVLNFEIDKPWEFNDDKPIRSLAIIEIFLNIPLKSFTKLISFFDISPNSIDVLFFFRIWTTLCSLINIYYVYLTSYNRKISMVLYGSSYISLVFYGRTFSNCWETQLLSLFLIIFSRNQTKSNQIVQGLVTCLGAFCRPTFFVFIFPFIFQRIINQTFGKTLKYALHGLIGFLSLAIVLIGFDTVKFRLKRHNFTGYLINDCKTFFENIVVVPFNFIAYNRQSDNLMSHGYHHFYTHMLVNVPLMLGPLFLILLCSLFYFRKSSSIRNLLLSILFPIFCLSLFPHQEMRFLLPLFPLMIVLISSILNQYLAKGHKNTITFIMVIHIIFSFSMTIFWGYFHEAGLLKASELIANEMGLTKHCHAIVTYKTLLLPKFLLKIDSVNPCNNTVVNFMGIEEEAFFDKMQKIKLERMEKSQSTLVHLLYPGAYVFKDIKRLESIGSARGHTIIQWHINTDLWHSKAPFYDFVSLKYVKILV